MVGNQRIGADRDNLIKKVHGKEIIRKGNANGAKYRQRKTGVKPGLGMLLQPAHIAHRIVNRNGPQRGGDQGKDHRHRVRPQGNAYIGQNGKQGQLQHPAIDNGRHHAGNNQE